MHNHNAVTAHPVDTDVREVGTDAWAVRTLAARSETLVILLLSCVVLSAPGHLRAQTVHLSTDVSVDLAGTVLDDEDVGADDSSGSVLPEALGSLPKSADVDAFHTLPGGDRLLSFDTTVELPSGLRAGPADVVLWDGIVHSTYFDADAAGVPNGVRVDAVTLVGGFLAVSFDTSVDLAGIFVDDEDLVQVIGGVVTHFDGSSAGIDRSLDLDGASELANGHLALSFDGSGEIGGVAFDDEDVLDYDPAPGGTWTLAYDGSVEHPGFGSADLDAVFVPEPAVLPSLAAGITLLGLLRRHRNRWRTKP